MKLSTQHKTILLHKFILHLEASERSSWHRLLWHVWHAYYHWIDELLPPGTLMGGLNEREQLWVFANQLLTKADVPSSSVMPSRTAAASFVKNEKKHELHRQKRRSQSAPPPSRRREEDEDAVVPKHRIYTFYYKYLYQLPVYGAIIVNVDRAEWLMVKGRTSGRWSFPRGKADAEETGEACAVREVLEETGLDIFDHIDPEQYQDVMNAQKRMRLFKIVLKGKVDVTLKPYTVAGQKEIMEVAWKPIPSCLYTNSHGAYVHHRKHFHRHCKDTAEYTFETRLAVKDVRPWIEELLFRSQQQSRPFRHHSSHSSHSLHTHHHSFHHHSFHHPSSFQHHSSLVD